MSQPTLLSRLVHASKTRSRATGMTMQAALSSVKGGATVYCTGRSVPGSPGMKDRFVRWLQGHMPEVAAGWKEADEAFYVCWGDMPCEMPG